MEEFFLVHIFSHSDWIRRDNNSISPYSVRMRENTDQKKPFFLTTMDTRKSAIYFTMLWFRHDEITVYIIGIILRESP